MVQLGVYAILTYEMLNAMANMIVLPILPFYVFELGGNAMVVSSMASTCNLVHMICAPIAGVLSDRMGSKRLLLLGVLGQGAVNVLMSFAVSVPVLLTARTLQGIFLSTNPVEMSYIMTAVKGEKELSFVLSLQRIMGSAGALLGPVIARCFASFGFLFLCRGVLVINTLNFLMLVILLREEREQGLSQRKADSSDDFQDSTCTTYCSLLRNGSTALLLVVSFVFSCGMNVSGGPSAVFYKAFYGFEQDNMTYYYMIISVSTIVWAVVAPLLANKLGAIRSCCTGCILIAAMCSGLVIFTQFEWMPYAYAGTIGLFGVMYGIGFSQLVKQKVPEQAMGSFWGLQSLFDGAAGTVGPMAGGAIYDKIEQLPNIITSVTSILTMFIFCLLPKKQVMARDAGPRKENELEFDLLLHADPLELTACTEA